MTKKHPGGRPPKYSATATIKKAEAYLGKIKVNAKKLPTIEGLALHLNISRETVYEWAKTHPEFSDVYERVRSSQAEKLIQKGVSSEYNSTITKLMLTKHGYSDKLALEDPDGQPLFKGLADAVRKIAEKR